MKNLKIYRSILSILFTGTVLATLSGCEKKQESKEENKIGHIDVINPDDISEKDFICYNIGNHEEVAITQPEKKLEQCEKKEISTAIIVDSKPKTRLDIYEDIEFTKSIIENYKIDLPVYIDIEEIMNDENLNNQDKKNYIEDYLALLDSNNIYVGLYGTSTNLDLINKYCLKIDEKYDCFVIEDGKSEYTGKSSIKQDKDGNIISTYTSQEFGTNLAQEIKLTNKNNSTNFRQNEYHIIRENDTLEEICARYNLSINEILKFNNISKKEIKPGTILRIPNSVQYRTKLEYPNLIRTQKAIYKGIDISHHQGNRDQIDFENLSKKIDFAILKIGEQEDKAIKTLQEDSCFDAYYNACIDTKISVGGYYVTRATTLEEAKQEAELVINKIKNLNITFPIYIDFETEGIYQKEWEQTRKNNELKQMLSTVKEMFENAGLRIGIYANLSRYSEIEYEAGKEILKKFEIWLSNPKTYKTIYEVEDLGPICKTKNEKYKYTCDMNQVSWEISDLGIGNSEGYVDYNLCYKDYKKTKQMVEQQPEQTFETKEYKRKDTKKTIGIILTSTKYAFDILLVLYIYGHRKRIKRKLIKLKDKYTKTTPQIIMSKNENSEQSEEEKENYQKVKVI